MNYNKDDIQLTTNFKASEFRCPCCGLGEIAPETVFVVQRLRDELGVPLRINSGVRCVKHNKEVGGVANSQHVLKTAADVSCSLSPGKVFNTIKELYNKGEIPPLGYCQLYPSFVHLDTRKVKANNIFNSQGLIDA